MSAIQSSFLKSLLKLLADTNDGSLDLDELAARCGYSKYYLNAWVDIHIPILTA